MLDDFARRSEPRMRNVCGAPLYTGVTTPGGATIVLRKTFSAMLEAACRTIVAVTAPLTRTMPAPASRKRFQVPSGTAIGRWSGIWWLNAGGSQGGAAM